MYKKFHYYLIIVIIPLLLTACHPEQKFVGTYVDWKHKASAIELKSDGTFVSNFEIEGIKKGKWEFVNRDEFYFILLSENNGAQLGRLAINERSNRVKLRFFPSASESDAKFELVEF